MATTLQSAVAKLMAAYPPRSQEETSDPVVAARLFDAFGSATWWLTEYDPEDRCAFGFVTWLYEDEWGYVALDELASLKVAGSCPRVEVDRFFEPMPMSAAREKYAGCFRD